MNHAPEALQLANQLEANYAHVYAGLAPAAAAALRSQHARIAELEAENSGLRILASGGIDLFERYSTFKAKCEELEAMLDAVGAGGVGQSIKPQIRADTAPQPTRQPLPPASPCPLTEDGYNIFKLGWRESEAAHGITGSQQQ